MSRDGETKSQNKMKEIAKVSKSFILSDAYYSSRNEVE